MVTNKKHLCTKSNCLGWSYCKHAFLHEHSDDCKDIACLGAKCVPIDAPKFYCEVCNQDYSSYDGGQFCKKCGTMRHTDISIVLLKKPH